MQVKLRLIAMLWRGEGRGEQKGIMIILIRARAVNHGMGVTVCAKVNNFIVCTEECLKRGIEDFLCRKSSAQNNSIKQFSSTFTCTAANA